MAMRGQRFEYPSIVIIAKPFGSGGRFQVKHAGRVIVASSGTPFCAAARVLLAEGHPPGATLAMRYQGEADFALRGKLGAAAKLTVKDSRHGKPVFARWKAPQGARVAAPID